MSCWERASVAQGLNSHERPEGLTRRTLHCISLSPFWDCKEQISLGHVQGGSVQFILSVEFDSLRSHESQHARPPCPLLTPGVYSNPCPLSRWCHPTISPSVAPSHPALNLSQHQGLFQWVSSTHQVAKVLAFQLQPQSLQWTPRTDLL